MLPFPIDIENARILLRNARLRPDITIDELDLDGRVHLEPGSDMADAPRLDAGEVRVRAMISEPNMNRMLSANVPRNTPVRALQVAVLTGKVRVTGQYVVLGIGLPFTAEAIIRTENGVRVIPDWQSIRAAGMPIPGAGVDVIEQHLHRHMAIDLTRLPVPVWIDEVRCEPGRVTVNARVRLTLPPAQQPEPILPFTAHRKADEAGLVEAGAPERALAATAPELPPGEP